MFKLKIQILPEVDPTEKIGEEEDSTQQLDVTNSFFGKEI